MLIKIIIAGSRNFNNYNYLKKSIIQIIKELKKEYPQLDKNNIEIISGGARGADLLGEKFAIEKNLKITKFIPDWNIGRHAGWLRNEDMAKYACDSDLGVCIAFWDEVSSGTKNMINNSNKYKLKTFVVKYNEEINKKV